MTQDLHFLCRRCHHFAPITGKSLCRECADKLAKQAQQDQALAKLWSEMEEHPELGWAL